MSEIEAFKSKVEEFIATREMKPTTFGKLFAGDPLFVFQLRSGREPRSATRAKVLVGMKSAKATSKGVSA